MPGINYPVNIAFIGAQSAISLDLTFTRFPILFHTHMHEVRHSIHVQQFRIQAFLKRSSVLLS